MTTIDIDLRPVDHISADALGQPGKRIFYLQGWQGERTITLITEKLQLQTLAVGIEQFLAEVQEKITSLREASAEYEEAQMHIHPPVDPLFRVGEFGLGYDSENDLTVLVAHESVPDGTPAEDGGVVRFWCTRDQLRALARWGIEVSSRGRPICTQCGEPMDPEGHFCPKKNGHKH
jgi:uncharacterized repeat protein (TIGR03847 family)